MKQALFGLYQEELAALVTSLGEPAFRARQLYGWLQKGAAFEDMRNLPKAFAAKLAEAYEDRPATVLEKRVSALDGTEKLLFGLTDGNCVEGVLMRYAHGVTLCLSTQVGCKMGCAFCASTLGGCVRNLTAAEMLYQAHLANRELGDARVHNIVLMGSGEPLDNYDEVVRFLRLAGDPDGLSVGMRHISLSTCGLVEQIFRFAEEGLSVTLSLSLHAPNDDIRKRLMPIATRYTIEETLAACKRYIQKTGRRVIIEYALVKDVNCAPEHALELASRLRGMQCHVNLIPLNDVPERALRGASEREVRAFQAALEGAHISVTRRREMGDDIEGACGQLRRRYMENAAEQEDAPQRGQEA